MFRIENSCPYKFFHITIYNHWADILFESNDVHEYFDAFDQPDGTYTWKVEYQYYSGPKGEAQGVFYKID